MRKDHKWRVIKGYDNCWWIHAPPAKSAAHEVALYWLSRDAAIEMSRTLNAQRYLVDSDKFPFTLHKVI